MVSVLVLGSSDMGTSPGRGQWPRTVPLSTQMGTSKFNAGGSPAMFKYPMQGGVEIFLVTSCYRNRDKPWPDGPLGLYVDFTYWYEQWGKNTKFVSRNQGMVLLNITNNGANCGRLACCF